MNLLVGRKGSNNHTTQTQAGYTACVSIGVNKDFAESIFSCAEHLGNYSETTQQAMSEVENIIILKNKDSVLPSEFEATENKFINFASTSTGFVSRDDSAIVLVEDNHTRKNIRLEGCADEQAADTFAHEVGHVVDKELSTTKEFQAAYLNDLKNIEELLKNPDAQIEGENLRESLFYLRHYMDGVNFEDGISEDDITITGLRENFAECFSTIVDENPSKINEIYSALFPNTMAKTSEFIV